MPCIVCGRHLEPALPGVDHPEQPAEAVTFSAYGQYGSTVFDPQDGSHIRINVCDQCLVERQERVWHCCHVSQPVKVKFSKQWDPGLAPS